MNVVLTLFLAPHSTAAAVAALQEDPGKMAFRKRRRKTRFITLLIGNLATFAERRVGEGEERMPLYQTRTIAGILEPVAQQVSFSQCQHICICICILLAPKVLLE